ncbi:MAG: DsrE family protein, partial [Acidobacteriota bacterium]|nr:DsrE family protein [Acidobacteriota bacterium]
QRVLLAGLLDNPQLGLQELDDGRRQRYAAQLLADPEPEVRLEAAARFMNMHAHAGIPQEDLQVKLVLHGGGTRAAMTNEAYRERYEMDNPSLPLLEALSDAGVEIFLCEQSRVLNGLDANEVSAPVKSALSAMTAVVTLQADGYQFLTY